MIKIFVPIKINSQRLPRKMLLPLGNKLLCQHIFYTLLEVKKEFGNKCQVYCFCSDEKIKEYLPEGILFLKRDSELDKNETKGILIYKSFLMTTSIKDKPLKKIKADLRITVDSIHNNQIHNIKNNLNIKSDTLKIPLKLTSTLIDNMLKIPPSNIPDFMYS